MKTTSYGVSFYAKEILSGIPFSLARYGAGEWRCLVPSLKDQLRSPGFEEWHGNDEAQARLRDTLLHRHDSPRYWVASWEHHNFRVRDGIGEWLKETGLDKLDWHWGGVWRDAFMQDNVHTVVKAMRAQSLPLVFVGPDRIRPVCDHIEVAGFISVDPLRAYSGWEETAQEVLNFSEPAVVSFSAGNTANILIHHLFPLVGEESFLIDFGALWDGMCGNRKRLYQRSSRRWK